MRIINGFEVSYQGRDLYKESNKRVAKYRKGFCVEEMESFTYIKGKKAICPKCGKEG